MRVRLLGHRSFWCPRRPCSGSCSCTRCCPWTHAGRKVGGKCQDELAAFKIDRSSHINKDIPLGACMSRHQLQPSIQRSFAACAHPANRGACCLCTCSAGLQGGRCQALQQGLRHNFPWQRAGLPQVRYHVHRHMCTLWDIRTLCTNTQNLAAANDFCDTRLKTQHQAQSLQWFRVLGANQDWVVARTHILACMHVAAAQGQKEQPEQELQG